VPCRLCLVRAFPVGPDHPSPVGVPSRGVVVTFGARGVVGQYALALSAALVRSPGQVTCFCIGEASVYPTATIKGGPRRVRVKRSLIAVCGDVRLSAGVSWQSRQIPAILLLSANFGGGFEELPASLLVQIVRASSPSSALDASPPTPSTAAASNDARAPSREVFLASGSPALTTVRLGFVEAESQRCLG
jgi:hypothetical protein